MFESTPLEALPAKAPKHGPFCAPTITRRPARGAQACAFLRSLWGQERLYIQDKMNQLPYPLGKKARQNPSVNIPASGFVDTVQDDLKAIIFRDCSVVLCLKDDTGWYAVPEVFALQSSNIIEYGTEIRVKMETPTQIKLVGPSDLVSPFEKTFWQDAYWWAKECEILPPVSTDFTNFLPSFAPLPGPSEEKKNQAQHVLNALTNVIALRKDMDRLRIEINHITPELDDLGKGLDIVITGQKDSQHMGYSRDFRTEKAWLKDMLTHSSFPLQGREWLVATSQDSNNSRNLTCFLFSESTPKTLSAHDKIKAYQDLKTLMPEAVPPSH